MGIVVRYLEIERVIGKEDEGVVWKGNGWMAMRWERLEDSLQGECGRKGFCLRPYIGGGVYSFGQLQIMRDRIDDILL